MATTTKKEIIDRIAAKTQIHRDEVKTIVTAFLEQVIEEVGKTSDGSATCAKKASAARQARSVRSPGA